MGALEASAKTMGLDANSARPALEEGVKALKEKMGALKSFQSQFKDNPVAKAAWEQATAGPIDAKKATEAAATASPAATAAKAATPAATNPAAAAAAAVATPSANAPAAPAQAGGSFSQVSETDSKSSSLKSTAMLFEELKALQQELQQVMQALSNVLNMMKENAMNAIRSIR